MHSGDRTSAINCAKWQLYCCGAIANAMACFHRLEELFHKKGKHLVIDTDDDDFSIASSELSAWDSDVASISSLTSCAAEWVQEAKFGAPADTAMKYGLAAVLVGAQNTC